MSEKTEVIVRQSVGMSDLAALLAAAFSFCHDDSLAVALTDGSFVSDWHTSWVDVLVAGLGACGVNEFADPLTASIEEEMRQAEHARMRAEFSRLFFTPGLEVPVWPYESAFLHRQMQLEDIPNLFLTKATVDVERLMAKAGVRPENLRTVPCDFCGTELQFLAYLYGRHAEALAQDGAAEKWSELIRSFSTSHVLAWMPDFFAQVAAASRISEYRIAAQLGTSFVALLDRHVETIGS